MLRFPEYLCESAFSAPPALLSSPSAAIQPGSTTEPARSPAPAPPDPRSAPQSCVRPLYGPAIAPGSQLHYRRLPRFPAGDLHPACEYRSGGTGTTHRDRVVCSPFAVAVRRSDQDRNYIIADFLAFQQAISIQRANIDQAVLEQHIGTA